jgi:hypothetical protein
VAPSFSATIATSTAPKTASGAMSLLITSVFPSS